MSGHKEQLNLDDGNESIFITAEVVKNKELTRFDITTLCMNVLILRMFSFCICGILHDLIVTEWRANEIFYMLGLFVY